jgi:hypothetical protein
LPSHEHSKSNNQCEASYELISKAFKVFQHQKKLGETKLNAFLINHLLQCSLNIEKRNINVARFVGEKFRPECLLRGTGKYPVCAIECKKLNDKFAKARWKEGLSQSLLYSQYYKAVIYVLFDYSTGARYQAATTNDDLGRGTAQLTMMTTIGSTVDLIEMGGNLYGLTGHRHRGAHYDGRSDRLQFQ